jgi:hypothetical protein
MEKEYSTIEEMIEKNFYDKEEPKTLALMDRLRDAGKRGYLTKDEFLQIGAWKAARQKPNHLKNSEKEIMEVSKRAFSTKIEKEKMELLAGLHGVLIPTASAILTVIDPKNYGVIDIRVWQTLYLYGAVNTNPSGVGLNFDNWDAYLTKLRDYAKRFNVPCRTIERTLFFYHKKIQEGNLYGSKTGKK